MRRHLIINQGEQELMFTYFVSLERIDVIEILDLHTDRLYSITEGLLSMEMWAEFTNHVSDVVRQLRQEKSNG
ncbi:hypothetical protein HOU79_gp34 [Vibrio phage 1.224.A._10N.261.48.B1]|uniref:Uncharacterized protein n=1 Tax=Vibrio phage 1.224.A._10N.261.48.B1 TaxID=1881226 RepID=A0A2I7RS16_9CAUD|nr:hypothetical protein HOU79_gp34 [Vibrio phage 1.224.A._10N.261.48.B1]AUR96439.1 hypothetical protein NVP1224A_72 [Vibrio phage 1.224.A._10N.261.48.B1]